MKFRNSVKTPFNLEPPSKLIIDTHGGIQDILGIMFAYLHTQINHNKQQIVGITCVAGKYQLDVAVQSAQVANMLLNTNIPIYRGQSQSLMLKKEYPKTHSQQLFFNLQQQLYKQLKLRLSPQSFVSQKKAVDFIGEACNQHKDNIGIICFGPLTNVGLAHRLSDCLSQVKMISLTGGQYMGMGHTVGGNIQPNFAHDPLAAHILFEKISKSKKLDNKIYVNVFEKTLDFNFQKAISQCLDSVKLSKEINDIFCSMKKGNHAAINCGPILTIAPFLQPKSVKNKYFVYGQIIRDGQQLNGLLAINWLKIGAKKDECNQFFNIYEDYDKELLTQLFLSSFTSLATSQQSHQLTPQKSNQS